jgi:Protein of unknown function (DUF3352)
MKSMRRVTLCALMCAVSLVGCGGSAIISPTRPASASGAEVAPADALAFVAIDTDRGSAQWKQADALLKKLPFRAKLLASVEQALSERGVSVSADVLPALGPEVDIVVMKGAAGARPLTAGLTQPQDEQKLEALLAKSARPTFHVNVGNWTAFSDTRQALDAITRRSGNLSDSGRFATAMAKLPDDANVKAYVDGSQVRSALPSKPTAIGPLPLESVEWLSLALASEDSGWKLSGAWKASQGGEAHTFTPTLLDRVPAGSLLVLSFKGDQQAFNRLRHVPEVQEYLDRLQQELGLGFDDLTRLFADEGVFYLRKSVLVPEVSLIVREKQPAAAMSTLNTVAARAAASSGAKLTAANAAGTVKKLTFDRFAVYYGIDRGDLVLSDSLAPFGRKVGSTIEDDPDFVEARKAAGLPDASAGFAYANVHELIPVLELLALVSGQSVPPDLSANLAPLESFLGFARGGGNVSTFGALLQVQ